MKKIVSVIVLLALAAFHGAASSPDGDGKTVSPKSMINTSRLPMSRLSISLSHCSVWLPNLTVLWISAMWI